MSLAVGAISSSKTMGFDEDKDDGKEEKINKAGRKPEDDDKTGPKIPRQMSESSLYATEDEDESDFEGKIKLGPQFTIKEQLEKDKDDESLRKWKKQLLGSVDINSIGVDSTKGMLGTFSPQLEPYMHEMSKKLTPSGYFARGTYLARTKFLDDDNKCYLEINYTFDIWKDW